MRILYIVYLFALVLLLFADKLPAQEIEIYDSFDGYKVLLEKDNDTTYVINFWATWCRPCVKEFPAFKKVYEDIQDEKLQFILTSMDFGNNVESRVRAFINRHEIPPGMKVVILDDPDSNSWINDVNPDWSGSIPATLIYRKGERSFYEQEFTYKELKELVKSKIQ